MAQLHLGQSVAPNKPQDFEYFRSLCEEEEGWYLSYDNDVTVHGRDFPGSNSKCIRVRGRIRGVNTDTMFDFMCDEEYRASWDTLNMNSFNICQLDKHTNIGYYCIKSPFPLQNRDVVFQRSWGKIPNGYVIMNHSVELPTHPPIHGIVRATSLITGYYVVDTDDGCLFTYLSHADAKVALPFWFCNKIGVYVAPGFFRKVSTAAMGYADWKLVHRPDHKPWRFEEQRMLHEYADPDMLEEWGFPPAPSCLIETDGSDSDSFHSLEDEIVTAN
ncbi:PCTP-like protein [Oopsacas minuta]|uniref:PCTP-like protein n=1 Tax=Oopsacas minuta TaxID=111878 RepID=A0AAV7K2I1_9METZ|nr:PCTP-like protein [Oopsacas minuta]